MSLHEAHVAEAIARLRTPHHDDGRRHPLGAAAHARSAAFLESFGLVPDARTRRYLDRAAVAEGMSIALPGAPDATFQLAVDWTNHNCLHDDAAERREHDVYFVADLSRRYAEALLGATPPADAHPLVRAIAAWRRRAVDIGADPALLLELARRAERMGSQFVLERLLARHGASLPEEEYLRQRVQDGPFDAWFALLDMAFGPARRPVSPAAERLQRLAVCMSVAGNELRTLGRELAQGSRSNIVLQAADPVAAIGRVVAFHNDSSRRFTGEAARLPDEQHREYAAALARAVFAVHAYEMRSVRGRAWAEAC